MPQSVCDWYLAVYVDAVEWVELPNTAGMALYANGGRFTSKPYVASGAYVKRMSELLRRLPLPTPTGATAPTPARSPSCTGISSTATRRELAANPRTALMVRNLARLTAADRAGIRSHARALLNSMASL